MTMIASDKFRTAVVTPNFRALGLILTSNQGLAAVSMKPPGQSYAAYVIDLRERFPQALTSDGMGSASWRERALALEDELEEAKLEVQKLSLGEFMRIYEPFIF